MRGIVFSIMVGCLFWGSSASAQQENGAQQFEGFNLQGYTDGGEKAWDVTGDTADIRGDTIEITNVDANRYGEQEVNLKAKSGTIDKVSGNIHLERDVVITSQTGAQLKTDTLDWQKEQDLVRTDDPVEITDKGMKANGVGLRARPGLMTAQMNRDVTVEMLTEPQKNVGEKVVVTCDGPMEIDQKNNIAVFNDNVMAVQTGRTLKADRAELYFDPDTQQIKQLVCIGNVHIIQGDNTTVSERAVYDAKTEKLTLYGRPKLIMVTEGEGSLGEMGKK